MNTVTVYHYHTHPVIRFLLKNKPEEIFHSKKYTHLNGLTLSEIRHGDTLEGTEIISSFVILAIKWKTVLNESYYYVPILYAFQGYITDTDTYASNLVDTRISTVEHNLIQENYEIIETKPFTKIAVVGKKVKCGELVELIPTEGETVEKSRFSPYYTEKSVIVNISNILKLRTIANYIVKKNDIILVKET